MSLNKLIVANWKSHKTATQANEWVQAVLAVWPQLNPGLEVVVAPPYPLMPLMTQLTAAVPNNRFVVGLQDISPYPAGSYTGAVSTENIREWPVRYCLVGHSERRQYFGESNQVVAQKITELLAVSITPVICVEFENIQAQAAAIDETARQQCVVAFDPMGAISTHGATGGKAPSEVREAVEVVKRHFGDIRVIYGGSVNASTVATYTLITDGVLVGQASLDQTEFCALLGAAWPAQEAAPTASASPVA